MLWNLYDSYRVVALEHVGRTEPSSRKASGAVHLVAVVLTILVTITDEQFAHAMPARAPELVVQTLAES